MDLFVMDVGILLAALLIQYYIYRLIIFEQFIALYNLGWVKVEVGYLFDYQVTTTCWMSVTTVRRLYSQTPPEEVFVRIRYEDPASVMLVPSPMIVSPDTLGGFDE